MSLWIFCADVMPKSGQDVLAVTIQGREFVGSLTIDSREGKTFQDEVAHTHLPLPKVVEDYCFKDMSGNKVSAVTSPAQQMPLPKPPALPKGVLGTDETAIKERRNGK